jgi:prepilin-type N-terminal cleavage/methylation domain-containing protein
MKSRLSWGFTLVEVLVVIAIIGILSSIIYANFGYARDGAKHKAFMTAFKETQLALELYKSQNRQYPAALTDLVGAGFIAELPQASDAANSNCAITYVTGPSDSWYKLTGARCIAAENANEGIQEDDEFARCPSSCTNCAGSAYDETAAAFYQSISVFSAGGQCE